MGSGGIFGREPTLWLAVINAAVVLGGTFGFKFLTGDQAALIVVVINAIAGAITAYAVRPIAPAAFTYLVASLVTLAAAYGLKVPPETVAGINTFLITSLALLTRGQVTPMDTAVSSSTGASTADTVTPAKGKRWSAAERTRDTT
jgi:hypothetical protein